MSSDERTLDRRAFLGTSLLVVGGVALGRVPVASGAPASTVDGFLALSRVVTGVGPLPRSLAAAYLDALDAAPKLNMKPSAFVQMAGYAKGQGPKTLDALEESAAYKTAGGDTCVRAIAAAWWSGLAPAAGGDKVITFSDALVWRVVHEPATCQGATGSWAKPGRAVE